MKEVDYLYWFRLLKLFIYLSLLTSHTCQLAWYGFEYYEYHSMDG